jgi:hypothetical protein
MSIRIFNDHQKQQLQSNINEAYALCQALAAVRVKPTKTAKETTAMTADISREAELAEKRRYWKQHIDEWRAGGQTQVSYCRNHHLCRHRFQYWKKPFHASEWQRGRFVFQCGSYGFRPLHGFGFHLN